MKIKNWYVGWEKDAGFKAPEIRRKALHGQIEGHPTKADGTECCLVLGKGVRVEGCVVFTEEDGQRFELGEPEPAYLKWLLDTGIGYDEANPIKMVDTLRYGILAGERPAGGGRGEAGQN